MSIDDQVGLVISDLRRAAIPGATGDAADRAADVLVDAGAQTGAERFAQARPSAVAVDGPGLFVLREGDRTIASRLGDFRTMRLAGSSGQGRFVVGFKRAAGGLGSGSLAHCRQRTKSGFKRASDLQDR